MLKEQNMTEGHQTSYEHHFNVAGRPAKATMG